MNREEAISMVKGTIERLSFIAGGGLYPEERIELLEAFAALRSPQPDPITGLVPCGCGGKAGFASRVEHWGCVGQTQVDAIFVKCQKCFLSTGGSLEKEYEAEKWNTAMGYTAPPHRVQSDRKQT